MKINFQNSNLLPNKNTNQQKNLNQNGVLLHHSADFKKNSLTFNGLNRELSKIPLKLISSIVAVMDYFPKSNGIVGNLPADWIEKLPKSNRAESVKKIYSTFKETINTFRENNDIKEAEKKLNQLFYDTGLIDKNKQLKLKYIDQGGYGICYHLKGIFDDQYVMKFFINNDITHPNVYQNVLYNNMHGNCIEPNKACYWQKYAGKKNQFARFYFADIDAGYMINKYIGRNTPICKKYINPEIYGLRSHDFSPGGWFLGNNVKRGYEYEFGGIEVLDKTLARNRKAQKVLKEFLFVPATEKSLIFTATKANKLKQKLLEEKILNEKLLLIRNSDKQTKILLTKHVYLLPTYMQLPCLKELSKTQEMDVLDSLIDELKNPKIACKGKNLILQELLSA